MSRQPLGPQAREQLLDIAQRLKRLSPNYQNPQRYHEDKSDLVHALLDLARG